MLSLDDEDVTIHPVMEGVKPSCIFAESMVFDPEQCEDCVRCELEARPHPHSSPARPMALSPPVVESSHTPPF